MASQIDPQLFAKVRSRLRAALYGWSGQRGGGERGAAAAVFAAADKNRDGFLDLAEVNWTKCLAGHRKNNNNSNDEKRLRRR